MQAYWCGPLGLYKPAVVTDQIRAMLTRKSWFNTTGVAALVACCHTKGNLALINIITLTAMLLC